MSTPFLSKVSFVNKISLIMKATSDDDKPIPGYLYKEISNITNESGDNCESCREFLLDRLGRDSTHVKLKVLKLMKYIVENGHPNFRLGLLKSSQIIKEATKHSGPPDPLHGNVPYVMVRKTAQGLSEVLFNTDRGIQTAALPSPERVPVSTMGIGPSQNTSMGSRMEGFGNTPQSTLNKSVGENIKDSLFKMAEKLGESNADHQRELLSTLEGSTNYRPPADTSVGHATTFSDVQIKVLPVKHVSPPKHRPGRAGGGWEDSDEEEDTEIPQSTGSGSTGLCERLESTAMEDFSAEENVISGYVEATSDMLLQRKQLRDFLRDCTTLNCDKVVEFLNKNLSSSADHVVMKSLLLLEFLMTTDLVNLDRLTSVCKEELVSVYNGRTGPPKSKARKIIRILEKLTSHQSIMPIDKSLWPARYRTGEDSV